MENLITISKNNVKEIVSSKKEKSPKKEISKIEKSLEATTNAIVEKISTIKQRSSIYLYPVEIKGNIEKEKQFRSKLRGNLSKFIDTYIVKVKIGKSKDFNSQEHFDNFLSFYKGNYSTNDFSTGSLRETLKDEERESMEFFLKDLKAYVSK